MCFVYCLEKKCCIVVSCFGCFVLFWAFVEVWFDSCFVQDNDMFACELRVVLHSFLMHVWPIKVYYVRIIIAFF